MKNIYLNIFVALSLNLLLTACGDHAISEWRASPISEIEETSEVRAPGVSEIGVNLDNFPSFGLKIADTIDQRQSEFVDFGELNFEEIDIDFSSQQLLAGTTSQREWNAKLVFSNISDDTNTQSYQEGGCERKDFTVGTKAAEYELTLTYKDDDRFTIVITGTIIQTLPVPFCNRSAG